MANFDHLSTYDVQTDKAVVYTMSQIMMGDKTPKLMCLPATEANKPFARAQLLRSNKRAKATGGRGISLETISATRDDDRDLYPKFIITGWEDIYDTDGQPVAYSTKECEEFLKALPNWIFDDLRAWCTNPTNFAHMSPEDVAAVGE